MSDENKAPTVGFLAFPPEVRTSIYQAMFIFNKPIRPDLTKNPLSPSYAARFSLDKGTTAFLRSCRKVHAEASPVFYGANVMRFAVNVHTCPPSGIDHHLTANDPDKKGRQDCVACSCPKLSSLWHLPLWLEQIGRSNLQSLRRLEICLGDDDLDYIFHEDEVLTTKSSSREAWEMFHRRRSPPLRPQGDRLCMAFDVLVSGGHQLTELHLICEEDARVPCLPFYMCLFRGSRNSPVETALERLIASGRRGRDGAHSQLEFTCHGLLAMTQRMARILGCDLKTAMDESGDEIFNGSCEEIRFMEEGFGMSVARYLHLRRSGADNSGAESRGEAKDYVVEATAEMAKALGAPVDLTARPRHPHMGMFFGLPEEKRFLSDEDWRSFASWEKQMGRVSGC